MQKNEFIIMRNAIDSAINGYKKAFEECHITKKWHSESINRMASPFLNGYFTLAVVGKMSSGKSTFINALLGADVLPTGYFQTTSAITYIQHGDKPQVRIVFADGHETQYTDEDLHSALKQFVAVPEEYSSLPINDLNILISGDKSWREILQMKPGIEEKTKCPEVDESLWEKYVKSHPKSVIAEEIFVYYPLDADMLGWRIVDTPGIGAIGGIQDETKKLFSQRDYHGQKIVDAIIFLQRGDDNLEDFSNVEFVQNTFNELTSEAKERLFFILTHATSQKFRLHREEILEKVQTLYGKPYHIPENRLTYVDSLLARFHQDVIKTKIDVQSIDPDDAEPLEGWNQKDCESIYELFSPIKRELKNRNLARNNHTMLSLMEEWGNFLILKRIINEFVRETKQSSYDEIINQIMEDYQQIINKFEYDISSLIGGEKKINQNLQELIDNQEEFDKHLSDLLSKTNLENISKRFDFVNEGFYHLKRKKDISKIRTGYLELMEKAQKVKESIFKELEDELKSFSTSSKSPDMVLAQIDYKSLEEEATKFEEEATKKNTRKVNDTSKKPTYKRKDWCSKKEAVYPKKNSTDWEKVRRDFLTYVIKEGRKIQKAYIDDIYKEACEICELLDADYIKKKENIENELTELRNKLKDKESEIAMLRHDQNIITNHLNEIKHVRESLSTN